MKKTLLIGVVLFALIAVALYLRERAPEKEGLETAEGEKIQQGQFQEDKDFPPPSDDESLGEEGEETDDESNDEVDSSGSLYSNFSDMEEQELNELEDLYDYAEEQWSERSRVLFMEDMGVSKETYEQYLDMREDFEEERWRAFEDFHKELMNNPNEEINATEYTDKVEKEIDKRYEQELREILGDDNFQKYLNARVKFNEQLREKQDPRNGMLLIDF